MTMALPSDASANAATVPSDASARTEQRLPGLAVAGVASLGAGAIHAGAIGLHSEHTTLSRLFVVVAVLQLGWGLAALLRPSRSIAAVGAAVNLVVVAGWVTTRITGIDRIGGLEARESPQFTDTAAAALGLVAAGAALAALLIGRRNLPTMRLALPAFAVAALTVPAMWAGTSHVHAEGEHGHGDPVAGAPAHDADDGHHGDSPGAVAIGDVDHDDTHATDDHHATDGATDDHGTDDHHGTDGATDVSLDEPPVWPRAWDPSQPIDLSGVPGVTPEQEARATEILARTQEVLPQFADTATAESVGFRSIGDARTGFEHYINYGYIGDEHFMNPEFPESLVYQVDGDERTLVSAMFIARQMPVDDPEIVDIGGPLMQWHIHDNLCWGLDPTGQPKVMGVVDAAGNCPPGTLNTGGGNPMVHVWIAPHQCGPFAALEGHGAGQVDPDVDFRVDQCNDHGHGGNDDEHGDGHGDAPTAKPYDPEMPIDLSGMPGVSPQEQARAENLIAVTLLRLPKYADTAAAEAAGYRTIGDGAAGGYEHYVNWSLINDGVILDPDLPESLVYERRPDGTKELVAAMYMLPDGDTLDTVPELGGPLTQWHIHNNLCYSNDPSETGQAFVIGLTDSEGNCPRGVKLGENPMLHVWITPHRCGPFAALDGIGAGQIKEGEERLCDEAHGSH
jgi:hypothetical protein